MRHAGFASFPAPDCQAALPRSMSVNPFTVSADVLKNDNRFLIKFTYRPYLVCLPGECLPKSRDVQKSLYLTSTTISCDPSRARFISVWTRESPPLGAAAFTMPSGLYSSHHRPYLSAFVPVYIVVCVCQYVRVGVSFWNSCANIAPPFSAAVNMFSKVFVCHTMLLPPQGSAGVDTYGTQRNTPTHLPLLTLMLLSPSYHLLL